MFIRISLEVRHAPETAGAKASGCPVRCPETLRPPILEASGWDVSVESIGLTASRIKSNPPSTFEAPNCRLDPNN